MKRQYTHILCYELNCVFPKCRCRSPEALTVFKNGAFKEAIKVKWGHRVAPHGWGRSGKGKKRQRCKRAETRGHRERTPCERTVCAHQGDRPPETPDLLTLWSWASSLWNCKKIDYLRKSNFCCLSHAVCGILLWPLWKTNVPSGEAFF